MKKTYVAFMLALVFLTISAMPSLAADTQAAYAKIPDDLLDAFADTDERLDVVVWLEDESTDEYQSIVANIPEPDFSTEEADVSEYGLQNITDTELTKEERLAQIEQMQNYIMQKRQIAQAVYLEDNNAVAAQLASELGGGEIVYISRYSPLIICNINLSEAVDIAMNNSVMSLTNGERLAEDSLSDCEDITGISELSQSEHSADGVVIGMLETGTPKLDELSFFNSYESTITVATGSNTITNDHASLVSAIIASTAPNFEHLYCFGAGENMDNMIIGVENLISAGANVINISWGDPYSLCIYDDYAKWIDHVAYNHSVHIVVASANAEVTYNPYNARDKVRSPAIAYNVITVGNTTKTGTINSSSCYNYSVDAVAFKPDICAPGTNVTVAGVGTDSGTSFSAPQVTGIVAVLCSNYPTLLTKQALMKSVLMNSVCSDTTHRYDTASIGSNSGYRKYGSGIVNIHNAMLLMDSGNYINDGMAASKSVVTYSLGTLQAGQTVSVTLAILKRARIVSGSHTNNPTITESELPNMDLHIRSATAPANIPHYLSNEDNNNNVQKLIFTATATDEYLIVINKTGGNDTYETLYAVSWMVDSDNMQ